MKTENIFVSADESGEIKRLVSLHISTFSKSFQPCHWWLRHCEGNEAWSYRFYCHWYTRSQNTAACSLLTAFRLYGTRGIGWQSFLYSQGWLYVAIAFTFSFLRKKSVYVKKYLRFLHNLLIHLLVRSFQLYLIVKNQNSQKEWKRHLPQYW